jgi:hypothetical protein
MSKGNVRSALYNQLPATADRPLFAATFHAQDSDTQSTLTQSLSRKANSSGNEVT